MSNQNNQKKWNEFVVKSNPTGLDVALVAGAQFGHGGGKRVDLAQVRHAQGDRRVPLTL